jgi:hypothetical protein
MVVLGLVLLVGAGVFTAAAITSNTSTTGADLWGLHISNISLGGIFVAGMVAGVAAVFGLVLLFSGMRRSARLNRERRQLARENARLARRQDDVDSRTATDHEVLPVNAKPVVEPTPAPVDRTVGDSPVDGSVREREVVRERVADDPASQEEYVPAGSVDSPSVSDRMKARASRWRR